jgi:tetratricopeptide (TPR) repeat protein
MHRRINYISLINKSLKFICARRGDNPLPEEARELGDYCFIGRERAVQALERAHLQQPQAAFLIHGMAGVGKTTLVKGFLHWLRDTNGLGAGAFWFSFESIRNAEYVINELVDALFGTNARAAPLEQKLAALAQVLRDQPFLLVWDNFESASGIAGTEVTALLSDDDRSLLKKLLKQLRGGKTKVLITSRSPESWLTPQECYRLPLSGLQGEELWEYCNAVVADFGLKIDRKNQDFIDLIKELDGHPLAIRAILLRLNERKAADLLSELKQQFAGQEGDDSTRRIFAALSIFDQGLPEAFAPILQLVGLHQQFVNRDDLQTMLQVAENSTVLPQLAACFTTLEAAGLLHTMGQNIYRMHPALHSHLSRQHAASEIRQRAFVDFMGSLADCLVARELHEQRRPFTLNSRNFHHALRLAQTLGMKLHIAKLVQSLACYAQNIRDYAGAIHLFKNFAAEGKRSNNPEWEETAYHHLGMISQEKRDFAAAERWYKQSLDSKKKYGDEFGMSSIYHQLGILAEDRHNFIAAGDNYKQALAISKKYGNKRGISLTYHQLGRISHKQRDFVTAEHRYKQTLVILEKYSNEHLEALTYHQLGIIAWEQHDFAEAECWYKQALAISEKYSDELSSSATYHQLGNVCFKQCDFAEAERWYRQALLISEKYNDEPGMAITYHQLGTIAESQNDFAAAELWYKKSLAIKEKHNNKSGAAITYAQLGSLTAKIPKYVDAGVWLIKAIQNFFNSDEQYNAGSATNKFLSNLQAADFATQAILRQQWQDSGLDNIITLDQLEQRLNDYA